MGPPSSFFVRSPRAWGPSPGAALRLAQLSLTTRVVYAKRPEHGRDRRGLWSAPHADVSGVGRPRKLRLGTAVTLLPYRHPLLVAEEIACLDNLSHGRVDVGIGRGFFKIEYDGLGISMAESRPRFTESLEVLRRVWTEHEVTHKGRFFQFE